MMARGVPVTPAVQRFFEQVSGAYQTSPLEVILGVLLVMALLASLVVHAVVRSGRDRSRQIALSRRLLAEKTEQLGLTQSHRHLLGRMQRYLKDETQVHLLVTDEIAFNAAAAKVREHDEASAQSVAALRVTLGFHGRRTKRAPRSSAMIPAGDSVMIVRNRYRQPIKARVLAPHPEAFRARLMDHRGQLPAGSAVDVYYHSNAGVFTFNATVLTGDAHEVRLTHAEELTRYQNRRYYRRRLQIPVHLYPFDRDITLRTTSLDIGGGGASLANPDGYFNVGDELELRFECGTAEIRVSGTVVRISDTGKTLHVNYEHIRDSIRDRIYRAIFRPPEDELAAMARARRQGANVIE
jgi:hypothetical protein